MLTLTVVCPRCRSSHEMRVSELVRELDTDFDPSLPYPKFPCPVCGVRCGVTAIRPEDHEAPHIERGYRHFQYPAPEAEEAKLVRRATCPHCHSTNEVAEQVMRSYEACRTEGTPYLFKCPACERFFDAVPTTTEVRPELHDPHAMKRHKQPPRGPAVPALSPSLRACADAYQRLTTYVAKYPEYADRDRDLLLLYLIDAVDDLRSKR